MDKFLETILDTIQQPYYLRAYKARDELLFELSTIMISLSGKAKINTLVRKVIINKIPNLLDAVQKRKVCYSTLERIIEILDISRCKTLYLFLESDILGRVKKNKYKAFWLMLILLKTKIALDNNTLNLETVLFERYLKPNRNKKIDTNFLECYIKSVPTFNRKMLFRHCLRYRQYTDSYGNNILDILFKICPEFEKFQSMR